MSSEANSNGPSTSPSPPPIRWWPGVLVAVVTIVFLLRARSGEALDHQQLFLKSTAILVLGALGMLLWLLLLSRLPGRTRLKILACTIVAVGGFAGLFRIKGVSGDLVPILEFRWAGSSAFEEITGRAEAETSPYDFPQFLGADRNGVVAGVRLSRDWQTQPPKELWRVPVGEAWSGFAVVGEAAVTLEQKGDKEVLVRYDLSSGDIVWTQGVDGQYESVIGGNGPRSTPTIHRGRVFAFGAQGDLRSVDLTSGELRWHRALVDDYNVTPPEWGFASSPLIVPRSDGDGDLVVVSIGGVGGKSLVAHDAETGEPVWAGGSDRVGYSSPTLRTLDGVPQILIFNGASVASHSPVDGSVLWTVDWRGDHPHVAQPHVLGEDRLLVSSGYGHGAKLFRVTRQVADTQAPVDTPAQPEAEPSPETGSGVDAASEAEVSEEEVSEERVSSESTAVWQVEELWTSSRLKAKFAGFVEYDGRIYGLDDGILVCIDPQTGERCWKRGRYGHGQILLVGDLLLVQTEKGELKLIEPNPDEHRELAGIKALDGKSWNTLTLSGNRLLLRNADEAVCYELPLADAA